MIRLTATLIVCIGVTMAVAGRDLDRPEGSDQPLDPIEVTRLDPFPVAPVIGTGSTEEVDVAALSIPLDDEATAVQAALRATEAGVTVTAPAPAPADQPAQDIALAPAPPADVWFVTGNRVNVRQGPSTGTAVIGQVTLGQQAEVLDEAAGGWVRIRTADDGTVGYIFGRFLSQTQPL